jgi:histidine ammonia-lyase
MADSAERRVEPVPVEIGAGPLDLAGFDALFDHPLRVGIAANAWRRVDDCRRRVENILHSPEPTYGVNTGFGALCTTRIGPDELDALQENLILSHAVGVGPPTPSAIVRLMLLLKIQGLCLGASGARRETINCLAGMLNADVRPSPGAHAGFFGGQWRSRPTRPPGAAHARTRRGHV